jgi:hypothetical protein
MLPGLLEIVGTRGRLRLVRHTGEIELLSEHGVGEQRIDARDEHHASIHFGADQRLVGELRAFAEGAPPVVGCREGHRASAAVFAALESIEADGQARDVVDAERGA